jgi:uncharacterized protein YecT (DUF1311 family)
MAPSSTVTTVARNALFLKHCHRKLTRAARLLALAWLAQCAVATVALGQPAPSCERMDTTAEMRTCLSDSLRVAEKELERYLAAARCAARPPAALDSAQSAWTTYRDAACRAAAGQYEGGSLQPVVALDCRLRLTRERTLEIWRAYLEQEDTLPEPVVPR